LNCQLLHSLEGRNCTSELFPFGNELLKSSFLCSRDFREPAKSAATGAGRDLFVNHKTVTFCSMFKSRTDQCSLVLAVIDFIIGESDCQWLLFLIPALLLKVLIVL